MHLVSSLNKTYNSKTFSNTYMIYKTCNLWSKILY